MSVVSLFALPKSRDPYIGFYQVSSSVAPRIRFVQAHPTMDLSSDCLFMASALIFCSTLLTSATGNRLNTSSGSISAQSISAPMPLESWLSLLLDRYLFRRVSGVDKPDDTMDPSGRGGSRRESARVPRRDEEGSHEISEEKEALRGR